MRWESCPLCADQAAPFRSSEGFWSCPRCDLVFRDPGRRLTAAQEAERYRLHRNSLDDPAYLTFLSRLADPLSATITPGARGLDFGCGPVRAMEHIMTRRGHPMRSWDPLFHPDPAPLSSRYDFVTCSEVVEHSAAPADTFRQLAALLEPHGALGVMTQLRDPDADFASWWYTRDPTHCSFYSPRTMEWIAGHFGWTITRHPRGVTLFRQTAAAELA